MLLSLGNIALRFLAAEDAGKAKDTCHRKLLRLKINRQLANTSRNKSSGSKREQEVRDILRHLTPGEQWYSVRPNWLRNPYTNRKLELDLFSPTLNIACEVQGEHHFTSRYIGKAEFEKQRKRDAIKRAIVRTRGVQMIEVPCERDLRGSDLEAWLAINLAHAMNRKGAPAVIKKNTLV